MRPQLPMFFAFASLLLTAPLQAEEEKKDPPRDKPKTENRERRETGKKDDSGRPGLELKREAKTPAPVKRTWVGVATTGIDYALREHLELAEGFGIQVIEVIPGSPADLGGLRNNDIITHFEDQHLISPEHLSILVKTKKSGEKVAFTIIRKGKEEVIDVTLGETDEDRFNRFPSPHNLPPGHRFPPLPNRDDPQWQESMKRHQDFWEDWMNRNRPEWRGNPSRGDGPPKEEGSEPKKPQEPAEGRPPSVSVNPGFPLRVFGSEGVLKIDNEKGELTLTRKDNDHTLEIKDAEGKVIHSGPFDPALGIKSLPDAARQQLEIMKLGNFEILLPDAPAKAPEKTNGAGEDDGRNSEPAGEIL